MIFKTIDCPDCNGPGIAGGKDGKCSGCYGTGKEQNILDALAKSLATQSQDCEICDGTGECQTCYGKGYLNV